MKNFDNNNIDLVTTLLPANTKLFVSEKMSPEKCVQLWLESEKRMTDIYSMNIRTLIINRANIIKDIEIIETATGYRAAVKAEASV